MAASWTTQVLNGMNVDADVTGFGRGGRLAEKDASGSEVDTLNPTGETDGTDIYGYQAF